MNYKKLFFITLLLGWTLAACSGSGPGATSTPASALEGTRWALISYGPEGSETQASVDPPASLQFEPQNKVGGSGGCNTFAAHYEASGDTLQITNVASTLKACDDAKLMEQEMDYLQALARAERFEIVDDNLTIWYDHGAHALHFERRWEQTDFPGNDLGNY